MKNFGKRLIVNDTRGTSLVEFAIALPLLFTCVLGVAEVGNKVYTRAQLDSAVQVGMRYALVHGFDKTEIENSTVNGSDIGDIKALPAPRKYYGCFDINGKIVEVTSDTTCDAGEDPAGYIEVSGRYAYKPIFVLPGISEAVTINTSAQARVE